MNRFLAILIGFFTVFPFVSIAAMLYAYFGTTVYPNGEVESPVSLPVLIVIVISCLVTIVDVIVLPVPYVMHVFKNGRLNDNQKIVWTSVILVGNILAMPFYWYWYMWKQK
jgi:hypothetical protein